MISSPDVTFELHFYLPAPHKMTYMVLFANTGTTRGCDWLIRLFSNCKLHSDDISGGRGWCCALTVLITIW